MAGGEPHPRGAIFYMLGLVAGLSLLIYRIAVRLALVVAIPLIWIKDRLTGKRRPGFRERLSKNLPEMVPGAIWIHAVSVGEVEVARRLLAELGGRDHPPRVVISSTTATGLELARRGVGRTAPVIVCPLDLPRPVSRVFEASRPSAVVLVETELWPELIHQAGLRGTPVVVVNGRLSRTSIARYRRVSFLLRPLLASVDLVMVRGPEDGERFSELGVRSDRIRVVGDIKYDLEPDPAPIDWRSKVRELASGRPVFVAGSTMDGEEELVLDGVARCRAAGHRVFTILAPRHPERFDAVWSRLQDRGMRAVRRSRFGSSPDGADVLLLDTIGELARAYGLGAVAFVGGSLVPTGGHNPLEPAVWGVPVLSGPHVFNFEEVYGEMVAAGGARLVGDPEQLGEALATWIGDGEAARAAGGAGSSVVEANRGATKRTVDELLEVMLSREKHQ